MRMSILSIVRRAGQCAAIVAFAAALASASGNQASANEKYAAIVVDHQTGKVLFSRHADGRRYPASLTKIMTLYLLFDELKAGRTKLTDRIVMSKHAASMPPSKLGLKPGSTIAVQDAIKALVTKSANDVAAAVGEHIAGTESAFARRMTRKARSIGMRRTTFRNASGLPDSKQATTARDMATLGRSIMSNHPKYYKYFSTRSFKYRGRAYGNHNRLLGKVKGVDGIKTGYTRASGFNLTSSVRRNNKHIVAVVMGGRTGRSRNDHMASLISQYLPAAVARRNPPSTPPGIQVAAIEIPLPLRRPNIAGQQAPDAIAVALASSPPAVASPVSQPTQTVFTTASSAPSLALEPRPVLTQKIVVAAARDPIPQEETGEGDQSNDPAVIPSGWAIQIGAVESVADAHALMTKAKTLVPGATASRVPFTEEFVKNGRHYVRARFAGFETSDEAKAACAMMLKKDFGCYPISL